jgi:hypothetical protein
MLEDQDNLFDRLVAYNEAQHRLERRGPDSGREVRTRRALLRYGGVAVGTLAIQTVADARAVKRQITWTRNTRSSAGYQRPHGEEAGSRMSLVETWDQALTEIGELKLSP